MIKRMKFKGGKVMIVKKVVSKWILVTLLIESCVYSQSFISSKNMELFGKQYTLAFKNENTNGALYEYTTDNESVENWTRIRVR